MHKQTRLHNILATPERRKYVRYNEGTLHVCIKRRGLVFELVKGEPVAWLNFNQYGLAFACKSFFNIGDELIIDLKLGNRVLRDLVAVIHNARRQSGVYRYGAQFYFGANSYMGSPDIIETLSAFEHELT